MTIRVLEVDGKTTMEITVMKVNADAVIRWREVVDCKAQEVQVLLMNSKLSRCVGLKILGQT
jgi:hypothetical protein